MTKTVNLGNSSYQIPLVGDQNYGEDLSTYLEALADQINAVKGPLDILESDFSFNNNQLASANITGLNFPSASVASFEVDYLIKRVSASYTITERGKLYGFQGSAGWDISRADVSNDVTNTNFPSSNGDIGVEFTITSGGQVQYTSNTFTGQISGLITFKARTLQQ